MAVRQLASERAERGVSHWAVWSSAHVFVRRRPCVCVVRGRAPATRARLRTGGFAIFARGLTLVHTTYALYVESGRLSREYRLPY